MIISQGDINENVNMSQIRRQSLLSILKVVFISKDICCRNKKTTSFSDDFICQQFTNHEYTRWKFCIETGCQGFSSLTSQVCTSKSVGAVVL